MIKITKENIIPYLKAHMPDFDDSLPVQISMVGEGTEEEELHLQGADTEGISGAEAGNRNQQGKPAGNRNIPQSS